MTLVNRTDGPVTGVLLRFDRELVRASPVAPDRFPRRELRLSPADTLRLDGGRLEAGESAAYELEGAGGAPRLLEARWIVDGRLGRPLTENEFRLR